MRSTIRGCSMFVRRRARKCSSGNQAWAGDHYVSSWTRRSQEWECRRTSERGKMERAVKWRIDIQLKLWTVKTVVPFALSALGGWGMTQATDYHVRWRQWLSVLYCCFLCTPLGTGSGPVQGLLSLLLREFLQQILVCAPFPLRPCRVDVLRLS